MRTIPLDLGVLPMKSGHQQKVTPSSFSNMALWTSINKALARPRAGWSSQREGNTLGELLDKQDITDFTLFNEWMEMAYLPSHMFSATNEFNHFMW